MNIQQKIIPAFGIHEEKQGIIIKMFLDKTPISEISRKLDLKWHNIEKFLFINGFKFKNKQMQYSFDENYFSEINTHEKAYILGLMYSDGWVLGNSSQIGLGSDDKEIINSFAAELKYFGKISRNSVNQDHSIIRINNNKLKNDLIKLGVVPKKSLILTFPSFEQVPEKFINSFILGYFDGDGTISSRRHKGAKIISSTFFCEGLVRFLNSVGIKTGRIHLAKPNKPLTSYFGITGIENLAKFKNYIYKDSKHFLGRKREKFSHA